jgi:hypothetical protein
MTDGAGVSQRLPDGGKEGSMAEDGLSALRPQTNLSDCVTFNRRQ